MHPGGASVSSKATGQGGRAHTSQDRVQQGPGVQKGPPAPRAHRVYWAGWVALGSGSVNGPESEGTDASSCGSPLGQGGPHLP